MKLIIKAITFYLLLLSWIIFLCGGAESLIMEDYIFPTILWLSCNVLVTFLCERMLTYRELCKITGNKYI